MTFVLKGREGWLRTAVIRTEKPFNSVDLSTHESLLLFYLPNLIYTGGRNWRQQLATCHTGHFLDAKVTVKPHYTCDDDS